MLREKKISRDLDLIGVGSAILDFTPVNLGVALSEVQGFVPSAGGAVSNLLVAASRLGLRTGFLGCVGDDEFGTLILHDFQSEGVDTSCVKRAKGVATGIAFYSVDKEGERHYIFYRFPGYSDPESALMPDDTDVQYIARSKAVHLSEALLRKRSSREAVLRILQGSRDHRVLISYDPNVRLALWEEKKEFRDVQNAVLSFVDVFISTAEEVMLITDTKDVDEAILRVTASGPSTVLVRSGRHYRIVAPDLDVEVPVFRVKAVDTSGAGDAFDGGFLAGLLKDWPLTKAVELGGAVAALKVMNVGTRKGLPRLEEVLDFIKKMKSSTM